MNIVPTLFESFKIRSNEVHADGKLSIPALGNFLQETAGNSAQQLGFSIEHLLKNNVTWVLSRLKIEMTKLPLWRQAIEVETWPSGYDRMIATRDFRIWSPKKECIGKATSVWMLIDLTTRRPVNVEPFLTNYAKEHPDRSLIIERDDKIDHLKNKEHTVKFNVRYGDLDLNNHVNNVHFMEWILEAVPSEVREQKTLQSIDIQFRAECFYGDRIHSHCEQSDSGLIIHELRREADEKEVARAQTIWK